MLSDKIPFVSVWNTVPRQFGYVSPGARLVPEAHTIHGMALDTHNINVYGLLDRSDMILIYPHTAILRRCVLNGKAREKGNQTLSLHHEQHMASQSRNYWKTYTETTVQQRRDDLKIMGALSKAG